MAKKLTIGHFNFISLIIEITKNPTTLILNLLISLALGLIALALFLVSRNGVDGILPAFVTGLVGYFLYHYIDTKEDESDI